MKALKTGIATLVIAAVALAIGVGVMAATGGEPQGNDALELRRDRGEVAETSVTPARRAELLRSQALNRRYGLGEFSASARIGRIKDPELRALMIRSDALNRKYKLGAYAPRS